MPNGTDKQGSNQDAPLSPGEATDATSVDASNTPDSTPPSSSEQDSTPQSSSGQDNQGSDQKGSEPETMADAIAAAIDESTKTDTDKGEKPAEGEGEKPAEGDGSDADADAKDGAKAEDGAEKSKEPAEDGSDNDEDADITDAEIEAMRPKARTRFKKLLSQRNEALREAQSLKVEAESFRNIQAYMAENGIEQQDAAVSFQVIADAKSGDMVRLNSALDQLLPLVQRLQEATGRAVPPELNDQVQSGELTEEVARQISQDKHARTFAQQQAELARQQAQQAQQQLAWQQNATAVQTWEQQIRATDPDFGKKADAMRRVAQALITERGAPKSPAEAVEYAKAAYAEAGKWFQAARPALQPSRPTPPQNSATRTGLAPAPTSLEDVISQALAS